MRRPRTNGAFRAVGSGRLRTDDGLILPLRKQIAVCSRPCLGEQRAAVGVGGGGAQAEGFCGRDEGEIPREGWRWCVRVCFYSLSHLETEHGASLASVKRPSSLLG